MVDYTNKTTNILIEKPYTIFYDDENTEIKRPIFEIFFRNEITGKKKIVPVKFDSGADVSFFGKDVANYLGIRTIKNNHKGTVKPTNGECITTYRHRLLCKILEKNAWCPILVDISEDLEGKNLLGRKGFLDRYGIILDSQKIYIFDS